MFNKNALKCLKNTQSFLVRYTSFEVGKKAKLSKIFTDEDVKKFAAISLDNNEVHFDKKSAQKAGFEDKLVHGILVNGLVSATFGTILPGKGCILCEQTIRFVKPVYIGDEVEIEVEIENYKKKQSRAYYDCLFKGYAKSNNSDLRLVINGTAKLIKNF